MAHPDLLIVGGGIIGCSAAAFAAERGASVVLVEATEIGAGASGRNSGVVQHPFDRVLASLHEATLAHYRALADGGFAFPSEPAGLLLLTDDDAAGHARVAELNAASRPWLRLPGRARARSENRRWPAACPPCARHRLAVRRTPAPRPWRLGPAFRSRAAAWRARRRLGGSALRLEDGSLLGAGAILVATGPWSADLLDPTGAWRPILPTYGVTVQVALSATPASVLEEGAVHTVNRPVGDDEPADGLFTFSMVTAGGVSTVGSTYLPSAPDPEALAPQLVAHGARFVPALAGRPSCEAASAPAHSRSTDDRSSVRSTAWIASS